jgi:hypothetical protein
MVYGDPRHLHPIAGRGYALKFALVGTAPGPAGHHLVPCSYLMLDGNVGVGEGAAVEADNLFLALEAGEYVGKGRIMGNMVRSNDPVRNIQVSPLKRSSNQLWTMALFSSADILISFPCFPSRSTLAH